MSSSTRVIRYAEAINEALHQAMEADPSVFLIGQGVKSPWYVGSTANGLLDRFGPQRVLDTPVSENVITGAAVGAAIAGMRPVVVHPRMDFMFYAFDPIINQAANWRYMSGGRVGAPVVVWGIINRGGEQAAQHSQALHAMFAHVPGLKVVMPSSPYDAKGLLVAAIRSPDPVVFVDDRWLYGQQGHVPEELYDAPIGKAEVRRVGSDVTVAALSYLVPEALKAASDLEGQGISVEVIDMRSVKPLDTRTLLDSVQKTGRIVVADPGWRHCGVAAEIVTELVESGGLPPSTAMARVTLPDCPAPAARSLEAAYYPMARDIAGAVRRLLPG
jgi:pyruvate/2-oxoglutarate/acetoin dehydrogenase E1 component